MSRILFPKKTPSKKTPLTEAPTAHPSAKYVLSLDVGTTGIRALILDNQSQVKKTSYVKTVPIYPKPGWVEMDPFLLWDQCKQVMKQVMDDLHLTHEDVACLGITTQRGSFVTWDKDTGKPLHNFITWQDVRTAKDCKEWNSSASLKSITGVAKVAHVFSRASRMKAAGNFNLTTVQVSTRLAWVFKNIPEAKQLADAGKLMFGTVDTWLVYQLTGGAVHATDYSNISSTGLFDPFILEWNDFIINLLQIPGNIFPEIRDTSGFFGNTVDDLFGGPIPITSLVADQQSALFGECCFEKGDIKVTLGTGMMLDMNTGNEPHASDKGLYPLVAWKIGEEITFLSEGVASSTGSMIEWGRELGLYQSPSETTQLAESVHDSNGVYLVPAFNGLNVPYNDPSARAAFMGLTFGTNRAHCVRALLEGIAYQFKQIFDIMKSDLPFNVNFIRMDGGVCNNEFLVQLCSTLIQFELDLAENLDMTALGAAYMAGLSVGFWKSRDELKALRRTKKVFNPHQLTSALKNSYRTWEKCVQKCLLFDSKGSYFVDDTDTATTSSSSSSSPSSSSSYSSHRTSEGNIGRGSIEGGSAVPRLKYHVKARTVDYQGGVKRFVVPDGSVAWAKEFSEYKPVEYTAQVVLNKPPWADVDLRTSPGTTLHFNSVDGNVDRTSFEGTYEIVGGVPRNPKGRTGMSGRGLLGRWGPNHAADPIVTRWEVNSQGEKVYKDGKPVLQFVAIKRKDTGQWAIPGGMVEPGDTVSATLKKEFGEEALNSTEVSEEERAQIEKQLDDLFHHGDTIYKGYVDDPRNTDNAWMETVAVNFHDDTGKVFGNFKLVAGDDAGAVTWVSIDHNLELYASHLDFIRATATLRNAHW